MNSNEDTYTMPLKQLLKLLETTADDAPRTTRRPRRRHETTLPSALRFPERDNTP